jgi:hypothetical protein
MMFNCDNQKKIPVKKTHNVKQHELLLFQTYAMVKAHFARSEKSVIITDFVLDLFFITNYIK